MSLEQRVIWNALALSVDEVKLQPHMVDTSNALAHHMKMAGLIQEFLDLFKDAAT